MLEKSLNWQVQPTVDLPKWFLPVVRSHAPESGQHAAQLLWQRGIRDPEQLAGFLDPQQYRPASPFEFGQEMQWAVERLQQARDRGETVTIWGDFDADGITATAVLWEGLGQFFVQQRQLFYYIPNRLRESHGLSYRGIDALAKQGCRLIVTCDTGSTNLSEIEYAQRLGLDVIVTDHHTLPLTRPPVTAIINPRALTTDHPLFNLSGVAVAYKLVEALNTALPGVAQQPLADLLDLVAIGLIADLVELSGDGRYLAQLGIQRLQQQLKTRTRPGVACLLEHCKKTGDRPTDISFGIGPRINAVSRIQGDARFCVELLTSKDVKSCRRLAADTEAANTRRKSLQRALACQVAAKLSQLDLSTTSVIVLADDQWPTGVLGLVAGQVAQEQGRPTILLSTDPLHSLDPNSGLALARGSARSVNQIDLYLLVKEQAHLLHRFGGHPFAAGLSLPVENITLFAEAVNRQLRQTAGVSATSSNLEADLVVTVAELGKSLFQELKLLEPCGMGNPVPKLLIRNCWFENVWNRNIRDSQGQQLRYIKTRFKLRDHSTDKGFPGIWWGHYKEDIPPGLCDAIVELDFNSYQDTDEQPHYEVRLIAVQTCAAGLLSNTSATADWVLDWRPTCSGPQLPLQPTSLQTTPLQISQCPSSWHDFQPWFQQAFQTSQKLAIAYPPPGSIEPIQVWKQLVGIAKYLDRTGTTATLGQLQEKLEVGEQPLRFGMQALAALGFKITCCNGMIEITRQAEQSEPDAKISLAIEQFLAAVQEEQFHRLYFAQVPLGAIQAAALQVRPT